MGRRKQNKGKGNDKKSVDKQASNASDKVIETKDDIFKRENHLVSKRKEEMNSEEVSKECDENVNMNSEDDYEES